MSQPLFNIPGSERQSLDWILAWHSSVAVALIEQRAAVQLAIQAGNFVPGQFTGMTTTDADDHYDDQRRELDRLTMLNLVASAEASITDDYFRRIELKLKDRLSRDYRTWYKGLSNKRKEQPSFDEAGILSKLKSRWWWTIILLGNTARACVSGIGLDTAAGGVSRWRWRAFTLTTYTTAPRHCWKRCRPNTLAA